MTGHEVWSIVAPILADCLPLNSSEEARADLRLLSILPRSGL